MGKLERISTGLAGFDLIIDKLRLGDNVVWQVDSVDDYRHMVEPYVVQAKKDRRNLIYIRFGKNPTIIKDMEAVKLYEVNAACGFEEFASDIHKIVEKEGREAFYVFDCLTELLEFWYSDLMIGNFFMVTCPYLYELDTIAYFAIIRNAHTNDTIAYIRETTQLLLNLYFINKKYYIHPLKVWKRYSPTMFLPHLIRGEEALSVTASAEAAELLSNFSFGENKIDYWNLTISKAQEINKDNEEVDQDEIDKYKKLLITLLMGSNSKMSDMCMEYFKLADLVKIASREIGTGNIGGKSVGMLLARRIITRMEENKAFFKPLMEPHDSYYLGSDIFYTYIVQNGLWHLRMKQRTEAGYFTYADELKERLLTGRFPEAIENLFIKMLEYYGQSPIIVRSSSLQEDNFGNAFAGKYESVFCANQGTPEERFRNFEDAVRTVYASTMNMDALKYRRNRGLDEKDEQMAILVQRVSGDYHGNYFFPHIAGVGNSSNLYVWDKSIDMEAGMLRMVFGLGTRAVDRVNGDYVKIVTLDDYDRQPLMNAEDELKFSQHKADVLDLANNCHTAIDINIAIAADLKTRPDLFAVKDFDMERRFRENGTACPFVPYILNFKKMLKETEFPNVMKRLLALLSEKYHYPVDIEYTANFTQEGGFKFNLLQCRPLQTKGLGKTVEMPEVIDKNASYFYSEGNFMGGNVQLPIHYVVSVDVHSYLALSEQDKYYTARIIGILNEKLKGKNAMLIGPGRWGTTTPSLGVPVHFTELCNMSVLCEVSYSSVGLMPELSYGSHFFQDLVESGIFYIALFDHNKQMVLHEDYFTKHENILSEFIDDAGKWQEIIRVYMPEDLIVYSDIIKQIVYCS